MYLVCYDITSDRVRNQIVKTLEGYGRRVQYSVFECDLDEKRYKELYGKLLRIMQGVEAQNGNICFYYICKAMRDQNHCFRFRKYINLLHDIIFTLYINIRSRFIKNID